MPTKTATHKPPWWKPKAERERQRKAALDLYRPSSEQRGYDADWRKLRARFLAADPGCSWPGCRDAATDVDHIEPISQRPDRRLDWYNLRAACHRHHSRHTAVTQGFARPRAPRPG